jgi:hypothetical protein
MTAIRFFTDEDVYGAIAVQHRAAGFDPVSTPAVDRLGALDAAQLAWAAQAERVFVTFNIAHFAQLHYQWMATSRQHTGVIVPRQRPIGDVIRRLLHLARTLAAEGLHDRLEYLSHW